MSIEKEKFGTAKTGEDIYLYTLKNKNGMVAQVMNFGAVIVNLLVPDKNGKLDDVVLGFDTAEGYFKNPSFFGVTIGPNANRIAGAAYTLEGKEYHLEVNDGKNNLHTDMNNAWQKLPWKTEMEGGNSVTFVIESKDGELGFPGNKKLSLTYTLTDDNELKLSYRGSADQNTILNPTNHSYFNLAGHKAGSIEGHLLKLNAASFTPVVPGAIPTGEIRCVTGTPLDFTEKKPIGQDINADCEQLKLVQGYDHNFVLDGEMGVMREAAEAEDPQSGRRMKVFTDLPGIQFYAGNCIEDQDGKDGASYSARTGFCLETHFFPDNIHHPDFPQAVFGPEKEYVSETIYKFL